MGYDRSKFRGAKLSTVQEVSKEAAKHNRFSGRVNFHTLEDGQNWFRIAPAHDPDDSPYVVQRTAMLECETDKWEDGEAVGKEIRKKKIFIATQHGTDIDRDPIELYIDYVYNLADGKSKDERQKFLYPITGWRANGKWNPGIRPDTKHVCYAWDKQKNLGRLELNPAWVRQMEKVSLEESDDNTLAIDIFSCPDEGFPLQINKGKDDNGKTEYTISADRPKRGESWEDFYERVRVSDAELAELDTKDPLKKFLIGVYTERDFNFAIDGLRRFDEKNGYGVFDDDEFLAALDEIHKQVPAYEDKTNDKDVDKMFPENTNTGTIDTTNSNAITHGTTYTDSDISNHIGQQEAVTPMQMKKHLREYIRVEYGEDYELPKLSAEELQNWYQLSLEFEELPFNVEVPEEEPITVKTEADVNPADELRSNLDALKRKRGKQ